MQGSERSEGAWNPLGHRRKTRIAFFPIVSSKRKLMMKTFYFLLSLKYLPLHFVHSLIAIFISSAGFTKGGRQKKLFSGHVRYQGGGRPPSH